jgi:hypothetical protein
MGRKVATQVHHAATRLIQGKLLSQPPLWYDAVARYPPLPLPPRQAVKRSAFDLPQRTQTTSRQVRPRIASPFIRLIIFNRKKYKMKSWIRVLKGYGKKYKIQKLKSSTKALKGYGKKQNLA